MNYQNPLSILSESQLQQIYDGNLKAVKKELMLQFQLEESVTLNLNGRELDKNGVIKLLEEIESDIGLHAKIFKNKNLLHFLEDGDLRLFEDEAFNFDEPSKNNHSTIIDTIIKKINFITGQCVRLPNDKSNKKLETIFKFTKRLAPHQQTEAYQMAYEITGRKIKKIKLITDPLDPKNKRKLIPDIHTIVDQNYYDQFNYLPLQFERFKHNYVLWCNNIVIVKPWNSINNLKHLDDETLRTIRTAAEIANKYPSNESIIYDITRHLNRHKDTIVILITILIFIVLLRFGGHTVLLLALLIFALYGISKDIF